MTTLMLETIYETFFYLGHVN